MHIIAHRGFHKIYKENSINAFKAAIGIADAIEMDLHKTIDNFIVIYHNPEIKKNKKILKIETATLKEIKQLEPNIPLYEDVLKTIGKKIKYAIEIKSRSIEKQVIELTRKYLSYNDYTYISFKADVLKNLKTIDSKIKTGLIIGPYDEELGIIKSTYVFLKNSFCIKKVAEKNKIDFVGIYHLFSFLFFKWARKNKKKLFLWTVNGKNLEKYTNKKYNDVIEGLITNEPDIAKELLKKQK